MYYYIIYYSSFLYGYRNSCRPWCEGVLKVAADKKGCDWKQDEPLCAGIVRTALPDMDREARDQYLLVIHAKDMVGQMGGLSGTTSVTVTLTDVNDNPPHFSRSKTLNLGTAISHTHKLSQTIQGTLSEVCTFSMKMEQCSLAELLEVTMGPDAVIFMGYTWQLIMLKP